MRFSAYGHANITAKHPTTIEFTKGKDISLKGDCIIGVKANFSLSQLKKFIKNKKIKLKIKVDGIEETITGYVNPGFNDGKEIVLRKSDFISDRTLMIRANKSCSELNKNLVEKLKNPKQKIEIILV